MNVFKAIPLTIRLLEHDNMKLEGGEQIYAPYIFDEVPSGWYAGQDPLDTSQKETQTVMRFDWKAAYASVNLAMTDLLRNSGSSAITNLVETKMQTAELTLRKRIAKSIFSDGNAFDKKELVGLKAAVDDTGSYGGIDRTTTQGTGLKSFVDSTGGNLTLDLMQTAYGQATIEIGS